MATLLGPTNDPWEGRIIAGGKYEIVALVGTGSLGKIYRGRHTALGRIVTVKTLHGSYQDDARMVQRFNREAQAASLVTHPNVVEVLDFGREPDGSLYIVMEQLEGRSLKELLEDEGALSAKRSVELMMQICAALGAAHDGGIIHRDMKPENVVVMTQQTDDSEEREVVKVQDFAIAKIQDRGPNAQRAGTIDMVSGTPEYMSPEQCRGETLDARADVYACGCLLFHMLCGRPPFVGDSPVQTLFKHLSEKPKSPSAYVDSVPPELDAIVVKALMKTPSDRYKDAREMRADLKAALDRGLSSKPPLSIDVDVGGSDAFDSKHPRYDGDDDEEETTTEEATPAAVAVGALPERPHHRREEASRPERRPREPSRARGIVLLTGLSLAAAGVAWYLARPEPRVTQLASEASNERNFVAQGRAPEPDAPPPAEPVQNDEPAAITPAANESDVTPIDAGVAVEEEPRRRRRARRAEDGVRDDEAANGATAAGSAGARRTQAVISSLVVQGSLDGSIVRRAIERVEPSFVSCHAATAAQGQAAAGGIVQVQLDIDERGRAASVAVQGGSSTSLDDCVAQAARRIVTSRRPDTGVAKTTFALEFRVP